MTSSRLRYGIFLAPFHPVHEHPGLALERDFQLVEHLDRLGYEEAWIGEHHSAGLEIIPSPELFCAATLQRTRHIRLGTGVSSLLGFLMMAGSAVYGTVAGSAFDGTPRPMAVAIAVAGVSALGAFLLLIRVRGGTSGRIQAQHGEYGGA
jgi:hypothetical protein